MKYILEVQFETDDLDPEESELVEDKTNTKNILITPVPGGVGLLTRAILMQHILRAYEKYHIWRAI